MGFQPVRKIIHSLKLVDYLHVQVDNPWYNYYVMDALYDFKPEKLENFIVDFLKA